MIHNAYQEQLAERSLEIDSYGDGESWTFYWFMDPISKGLTESYRFHATVTPDGEVHMHGMWIATNEREALAQEQAIQFVKERFRKVGLSEEEDTESRNRS